MANFYLILSNWTPQPQCDPNYAFYPFSSDQTFNLHFRVLTGPVWVFSWKLNYQVPKSVQSSTCIAEK